MRLSIPPAMEYGSSTMMTSPPVSRRKFIKQTSSALLASSLLDQPVSSQNTPDDSPHQMTLDLTPRAIGVNTNQLLSLNALATKHGFTSVAPPLGQLAELSDSQLGELLAQMKEQGITWGTAGCPVSVLSAPSQYESQLARLPALARSLAKAGGTRVNTYISPSSASMTYMTNFQLWSKRLRQIAAILKDHGQRLGLEYIGTHTLLIRRKYPFIHTMAETKDLIDDTGASNIGFVLDSWHWWQAGDRAEDILTLKGEEIIAVDLNDAPRDKPKREQLDNQRELPMATGVIDTRSFLSAINQTGFDGPVRAEPFNAPLNRMDDEAACAMTSAALKKAFALLG